MRKILSLLLVASMILAMSGCGSDKTENESTNKKTESSNESKTAKDEESKNEITTKAEAVEQETTTSQVTEQETTTQKETESQTQKPTEPKTDAPTQEPVEAPIVKKVGTVADAEYKKAVSAFEGIVKKMRADGIIKSSDVCVTMDSSSIKVDINFNDKDTDIELKKDNSTNIYTLKFDYDFNWIEELAVTINNRNTATYNKELLLAVISMASDEPKVVFDRIDLDCFSAAGLSNEKWTEIGDCFIMTDEVKIEEFISYKITKEAKDTRNSTCVLTGKTGSGATVECVIEYNSSVVSYSTVDNGEMNWTVNGYQLPSGIVTKLETVDESKIGPCCYPLIKNGFTSYENYKKAWVEKYVALGDPNAEIMEFNSHTVNGYTYYFFEGSYNTETEIGDPDIIYVQIGENEYIELYNVMFEERLEDFVNESFYIKEVKVK